MPLLCTLDPPTMAKLAQVGERYYNYTITAAPAGCCFCPSWCSTEINMILCPKQALVSVQYKPGEDLVVEVGVRLRWILEHYTSPPPPPPALA